MDAIQSLREQQDELDADYQELSRRINTRMAGGGGEDAAEKDVRSIKQAEKSDTGLTADEEQIVKQMRARDAEVRRHEEAHATVGGQYAGAPSYTFQTGPDDKRYAVAGEVPIDVSPVRDDPEATILKMEVVKAAALAPAEPSGADRRVAALAENIRAQAVADLFRERVENPMPREVDAGTVAKAYGNSDAVSSAKPLEQGPVSRSV